MIVPLPGLLSTDKHCPAGEAPVSAEGGVTTEPAMLQHKQIGFRGLKVELFEDIDDDAAPQSPEDLDLHLPAEPVPEDLGVMLGACNVSFCRGEWPVSYRYKTAARLTPFTSCRHGLALQG